MSDEMSDETRYKITILTYYNKVLTFTVSDYKIEHSQVIFTDEYTGTLKRFPTDRCQVEEIPHD